MATMQVFRYFKRPKVMLFVLTSLLFIYLVLFDRGTRRFDRWMEYKSLHSLEVKTLSPDMKEKGWGSGPSSSGNTSTMPTYMKRVLRKSFLNVDEAVLGINVNETLSVSPHVAFHENRVVSKLQSAYNSQQDRSHCVIFISFYCGRPRLCETFVVKVSDDMYLRHNFSCHKNVPLPCRIEFQIVANMTREIMMASDVVIMVSSLHEDMRISELMAMRPPGQLWALMSHESPQHDPEYAPPPGSGNPYNLTMMYFRDADLFSPFCFFQKKTGGRNPPPVPPKTGLMTWMASNCHRLSWRRNELMATLSERLPVDTYGKCGKLGPLPSNKVDSTIQQYKFYLAVENSECDEYVTEKPFKNGLLQGVVPIVYGARRQDYERILPKGSYINLEDFSSIGEFVEFIKALDADDERYNHYFDWRRQGIATCVSMRSFLQLRPDLNMCYLLRKFVHLFVHPETSWHRKVPDFRAWWHGQCSNVTEKKYVLGVDFHQPKKKSKMLS